MPTDDLSALRPEFQRVADVVRGVPWTVPSRGWVLYEFVKRSGSREIVELGCAFGVGTCYLAAGAAADSGQGHVTTYDLETARSKNPNLISLLERTGLHEVVSYRFDNCGYNWLLGEAIEQRRREPGSPIEFVDFCFVDGAHSWDVDGLAFFLIDTVLKPGGWLLFDDLHWTFGGDPMLADTPKVRSMSASERTTPQMGRVFDLLVAPNPAYDIVERWHNWGWARKRPREGCSVPHPMARHQLQALLAEADRNNELTKRDAEATALLAQRHAVRASNLGEHLAHERDAGSARANRHVDLCGDDRQLDLA